MSDIKQEIREALSRIPDGLGALILEHDTIGQVRCALTRAGEEIESLRRLAIRGEQWEAAADALHLENVTLRARVEELEGALRRIEKATGEQCGCGGPNDSCGCGGVAYGIAFDALAASDGSTDE